MRITKEHYIDRDELCKLDIDTQHKVCDIFILLSGGNSKVTEGSERLSVDYILSLESECEELVRKIKLPTRG